VDSKAECVSLIRHSQPVKIYKKEGTKICKCQCPLTQLSSVQVQDLWRQSGRNQSDYGGTV